MRLRSTALEAAPLGAPSGNRAPGDGFWGQPAPVEPLLDGAREALQDGPRTAGTSSAGTADALDASTAAAEQQGRPYPAVSGLLLFGDPRIDPRVVAAFDAQDKAVARVRELRAALTSRWHADSPDDRRAVALVGMDPSVDVATVAANLAVVSAQLGWRTLLIDGDLQAPIHDGLFRVSNDEGLSTLLQHPGRARASLQPTAVNRLLLLPAGPPPPNPIELLERQPLLEALDGQIGRHRLLLLSLSARAQSPQFGAIDAILSGFDGAILVASRNHSGLRPLQRLTTLLEERAVPMLGTAILP